MLTSGDAEITYIPGNSIPELKIAKDVDVVIVAETRIHAVSIGLVKEMFVQCRDVLQRLDVDTDSL